MIVRVSMRLDLGTSTDFIAKGWGRRVKALRGDYSELRGYCSHRYVHLSTDRAWADARTTLAVALVRAFPADEKKGGTCVLLESLGVPGRMVRFALGDEDGLVTEVHRFIEAAEAAREAAWRKADAEKLRQEHDKSKWCREQIAAVVERHGADFVRRCLETVG